MELKHELRANVAALEKEISDLLTPFQPAHEGATQPTGQQHPCSARPAATSLAPNHPGR